MNPDIKHQQTAGKLSVVLMMTNVMMRMEIARRFINFCSIMTFVSPFCDLILSYVVLNVDFGTYTLILQLNSIQTKYLQRNAWMAFEERAEGTGAEPGAGRG